MTAVIQIEYGQKALLNKAIYSATRNFEDVRSLKDYKSITDKAIDVNKMAEPQDREGIEV